MDVPGDLVKDRFKHIDGDEAHSGFDHATREEAALAESVQAVLRAQRFGFLVQLESFAGLLGRHQRVGLMEGGVHQPGLGRSFEAANGRVDHGAPILAAVDAEGGQIVRRKQIRHAEVRVRRVGIQHEGIVVLTEETGGLAMGHVAARVADRMREQDVRRDVAVGALDLGDHAAEVGILDAALEQASGLHHLMARVVDRGGGVIDAADERIFVGMFGHARKILADLDLRDVGLDRLVRPANLDGSVRLHIPGIELGGSADKHQ